MKKLLVAAIAVLIASPAFAAVQNVKVSGDIQTTYVDRQDFDLGVIQNGTPAGLVSQSGVAEQTRVRVDADLTDNVSATVRLINETAWGLAEGDNGTTGTDGLKAVDLDLAYVTLREFLYSPLSITVGRQEFYFGNGLIIGGGPGNITTGHFQGIANDLSLIDSNDGVKVVLDYKPLTLTSVYIANAITSLSGQYEANEHGDSDIYGFNANYQLGDAYNTVLEGYLFSRIDGSKYATPSDASYVDNKGDTLFVPGLRASTNPVKGLNVQGELAWQAGKEVVTTDAPAIYKQEAEHRDAMAAQLMATYSLPVLEKYKPAVNAAYTYVSGDKNGAENYDSDSIKSAKVYKAWDPMLENQGGGTIYNALFPLTDLSIYTLGASVSPLQDVTAAFAWHSLWAADKFSAQNPLVLYQPDSTSNTGLSLRPATNYRDKAGLGNEYDVNLGYAYTEDVSFGLNLGWFAPGDVFADANRSTASQAIADIAVKF